MEEKINKDTRAVVLVLCGSMLKPYRDNCIFLISLSDQACVCMLGYKMQT